mgnify:CR=1 FL=1
MNLRQDWFEGVQGFEWDEGNAKKNFAKHGISITQCEEIFLNEPLIVLMDEAHSKAEARFQALGQSNDGHALFVAFTVRIALIRVISARPMSRQERRIYEKAEEAP